MSQVLFVIVGFSISAVGFDVSVFEISDRKSKIPKSESPPRSALGEWRERRRNLRNTSSKQHQDMLDMYGTVDYCICARKGKNKNIESKTR